MPARLRVGFATYFKPGFLEDHWVCEYWREGAWRLLDAQIDPPLAAWFRIDFDVTDLPADRFLRSGEAWQRVATGEIPAARLGVSFIGIAGTWFAAGSVFRDMAVLSGREELLPWDYWGLANDFRAGGKVPDSWLPEIDELAALTMSADVDLDSLLRVYADRDWL